MASGARRVRRHCPAVLGIAQPLCLTGLGLPQHLHGVLWREGVGDVAGIDAVAELLRRHLCHDTPHRLAQDLVSQVPDGVHDGAEGKVDDALLGPDPSEMAVVDEVSPRLAPASRQA